MKAQQALWTGGPILLIEDEPSVTAFLRAALERKGYAVVNASSGAEGLQRLSNGRYAGVISDIRMPGAVNGAEVHGWSGFTAHGPEAAKYVRGGVAEADKTTFAAYRSRDYDRPRLNRIRG